MSSEAINTEAVKHPILIDSTDDTGYQHAGAYCVYPPRIADEIDVTEQQESGTTRYLVRNHVTSRYFILKPAQYQIFGRINGINLIPQVAQPDDGAGPRATRQAVVNFLAKLDSLGLLSRGGEDALAPERGSGSGLYVRYKLFDPNQFLGWLDRTIGWALTAPVIIASFVMMVIVTFGMLIRADEVAAYTSYTYTEYGLGAIIIFALVIGALHEMAHGLACKHFGGDVPEVGVLMVFYVLPAFYCNVSDIYRFGRRRERLWVVGAGIYWQLLVSAAAGMVWLVATPYSILADCVFLILLGGTFNVLINCNPLIKLDGYYALSQLAGVTNLQARSSAYVTSLVDRVVDGANTRAGASDHRPALYVGYWAASILYSATLVWLIMVKAGGFLMDWFGFAGVVLSLALAVLFGQRFFRPVITRVTSWVRSAVPVYAATVSRAAQTMRSSLQRGATDMSAQASLRKVEPEPQTVKSPGKPGRRRMIKIGLAALIAAIMIAPWEASAGSDCTLELPPGREASIRANVDAVLAEVYVVPGDVVAEGAKIARLANPDLEDRLTELNAQIAALNTRNTQIEDELRIRSEMLLSAGFKENQSQRLADQLKAEADQITRAGKFDPGKPGQGSALPPSMAALQSEVELKQVELSHNRQLVERYKGLYDQGLIGAIQYETAVSAVKVSEKEVQEAKARLDSAMVDHSRLVDSTQTGSLVAQTEARSARSSFESLISELHSNRDQLEALRERHEILQKQYDGMNVLASRSGVILGDDLRKMAGSHYNRGQELCHIGDLQNFILKIDVSERDIASVRIDSPVRFKMKTVPGRTFEGRVSKIKAESTTNQYGQRVYPVEVMVDNRDGLLKPGMTGFARISFGREAIGAILAQRVWQALRPELWLF